MYLKRNCIVIALLLPLTTWSSLFDDASDLFHDAKEEIIKIPDRIPFLNEASEIGRAAYELGTCLSTGATSAQCCNHPSVVSEGYVLDSLTNLLCMTLNCVVVKAANIVDAGKNISGSGMEESNFMQFREGVDPTTCNCISLVGACIVAKETVADSAELNDACEPIQQCCNDGVTGNDSFNLCIAKIATEGGMETWRDLMDIMGDTSFETDENGEVIISKSQFVDVNENRGLTLKRSVLMTYMSIVLIGMNRFM
mmetsp:Transcript_15696/g.32805  ORF Transcript_15696/g.32805 Transcript_15696/m.32805 type:complete len:254 (+) Transcript_15696:61-822(+)